MGTAVNFGPELNLTIQNETPPATKHVYSEDVNVTKYATGTVHAHANEPRDHRRRGEWPHAFTAGCKFPRNSREPGNEASDMHRKAIFSAYIVKQLSDASKATRMESWAEFTQRVPEAAGWSAKPKRPLKKGLDDLDEVSIMQTQLFTWKWEVLPPGTSEWPKSVLCLLRHWLIEFVTTFASRAMALRSNPKRFPIM